MPAAGNPQRVGSGAPAPHGGGRWWRGRAGGLLKHGGRRRDVPSRRRPLSSSGTGAPRSNRFALTSPWRAPARMTQSSTA